MADAKLAEAVRRGWVTPRLLDSLEPPPRLPVAELRDLLRELEVDRSER